MVALQQHDRTPQPVAARNFLGEIVPAAVCDAMRVRRQPRKPQQARQENRKRRQLCRRARSTAAVAPRSNRAATAAPREQRARHAVAAAGRPRGVGEPHRSNGSSIRRERRGRRERQRPRRHDGRKKRHGSGAGDARGQHPVPQRCGTPPQEERHGQRAEDDQGHLHRLPSFFALSMSSAMRSSSSSDSFAPSPPSTAATTCSADPSKNVSTR